MITVLLLLISMLAVLSSMHVTWGWDDLLRWVFVTISVFCFATVVYVNFGPLL